LNVSRGAVYLSDGQLACARCGKEPRRKGQAYGRKCHAEYCRERRQGMVEVLLTPEEWASVKAARERAEQHRAYSESRYAPRHAV
jgi:hypothetical protein